MFASSSRSDLNIYFQYVWVYFDKLYSDTGIGNIHLIQQSYQSAIEKNYLKIENIKISRWK